MGNYRNSKIIFFISVLLLICIFARISFLLIYQFSFLPNGYDILSKKEDSVVVKSYNIFGMEDEIISVKLSDNRLFTELKSEIDNQKLYLWAVINALFISLYSIILSLINREKIWKITSSISISLVFLFLDFLLNSWKLTRIFLN